MREQNRSTEAIISNFENLSHGSDEHDPTLRHMSPTFLHRITHAEPLEDDIYENTDTEDGGYDLIDMIDSNRKLIAFTARQSETILRLRARIARMGDLISILNANTDEKFRKDITALYGDLWNDQRGRPVVSSNLSDDGALATVLMDTDDDKSFLIQPNQHPNLKLDLLPNPKVMK
jgi:hypothetical protein